MPDIALSAAEKYSLTLEARISVQPFSRVVSSYATEVARPAIVARIGHHPRADRVQFEIAGTCKQVGVGLRDARFITTFSKFA